MFPGIPMIAFERIPLDEVPWQELDQYPDRTVFQTLPWLRFLNATQGAEPVIARIREDGRELGYFTGLVVRRFGVRILGSPLKGWTTHYMGFNLRAGEPRGDVLSALPRFAFDTLRCQYLELKDRRADGHAASLPGYSIGHAQTYEIDLTAPEKQLVSGMAESCRYSIRRADREGLMIEEASDLGFADDYFAQMKDVFAKQSLVPTYGVDRIRALIRELLPAGHLLLLRARAVDGTCVATGIFPAFNDTAYFWGGASWRAHQRLRPNEPLMWHAMRYWKSRGMRRLDLGGGGTYKEKYGVQSVRLTRFMYSRLRVLTIARHAARQAWRMRQRLFWRISSG